MILNSSFPFFSSKHFPLLKVPNRNPQTKNPIKHGEEKGRRSMSTHSIHASSSTSQWSS